jgi:RIO kinase 1
MALYRLMNHGVIGKLQHPVKQGKESLVIHALASDGRELAVKVHTSKVFREHERKQYLFGDWRLRHAKRHITQRTEAIGAEKEFRNLRRLEKAGVPAPRPVSFYENIVVMSFIGRNGEAASPLNTARLLDHKSIAEKMLRAIRGLVLDARLVHGDLSPYNILVWKEEPYVIDLSQAVLTTHPDATRLLRRDMEKVIAFFSGQGVDTEPFDELSRELLEQVGEV